MKSKLKLVGLAILLVIATLFLYIILHEAGHCIVAIACGAEITEFSILNAHMTYNGGNFSDLQRMWFDANGVLFPLIISYVSSFFYQKESTNRIYQILSYFVAFLPMFSLFGWTIMSILYLNGNAPIEEDCTKFLDTFSAKLNHSPFLVVAGSILIIALSVTIIIKKKILKNFIDVMKAEQ